MVPVEIAIPNGDSVISIRIPSQNLGQIVRHEFAVPLIQPELAVQEALDAPLGQKPLEAIVRQCSGKIAIVCDDNTNVTVAQPGARCFLGREN